MEKKYMALLLGGLIFWSSASCGQNVYKWVDDDGVVHFGARPPVSNNHKRPPAIETVVREGEQSNDELIKGSWWGHARSGALLNLIFEHGGHFRWLESYPGRRSDTRLKGSYKLNNDGLVLEYGHSLRYETRYNEPQEFIVSELNDRTLRLIHERRPMVFKRLQSRKVTPMSGEIYGKWIYTEDRGEIYDFTHGRFRLLKQTSPHRFETMAEGNWDWTDPMLQLDVVVDYTRNQLYSGATYRWRVLDRGPDLITIKKASEERAMRLERLNTL